ncbi:hypothetical protein [Bacillus sp. T9C1]|uniref:hypothetical protein n=1 Tax=Bacillus sp. T9C1 TaxID=2918912 RepID=UPI00227F857F|nr:hypothetical protein [Bacillus sp. T9C1]
MKFGLSKVLLIIVGAAAIFYITVYGTEQFRHNAVISTMNESAKIAGIKSLDNSVRVKPGEARISESEFEKVFAQQFEQNSNVKVDHKGYQFKYLKSNDGAIKAIKIILTDERGTTYPVTYVSNIKTGT